MIKEVIFDCFGVLTQDGWLGFLKTYANDENIEQLRYLNHQADKGLISYQEFLNEASRLCGVAEEVVHQKVSTDLHLNTEMFELIKSLKEKYKIGLISNVGSPIENYLPPEWIELFDHITLSYKVGAIKPSPEIYEAHLGESGSEAEQAVFIDDREPNVVEAHNLGIHGIWFRNINQLKDELQALHVKN